MDQIDDKEVFRAECRSPFPSNLFKETEKFWILYVSVQSDRNLICVCMGKIREQLALTYTFPVDKVETLASAFDKPASGKSFGDSTVPWLLLPQNIVRGDSGRESTGADDLYSSWELPDEHGPAVPVVAVAYGVEHGFSDGAFVERWHVPDKQAFLKMLQIVSEVDERPYVIENGQESLTKFTSFRCWTRDFTGPVLKYDFCLSEEASQRLAGT